MGNEIPRTPGREKAGGTAEQGYLHCGQNGAGHFVKMVHNGIEYGIMAAYAEGLGILRDANVGKQEHDNNRPTPVELYFYERMRLIGRPGVRYQVTARAMKLRTDAH